MQAHGMAAMPWPLLTHFFFFFFFVFFLSSEVAMP